MTQDQKREVRRWFSRDKNMLNKIPRDSIVHNYGEFFEAAPVEALLKEKDAEIAELKDKLKKCGGGCYI